jgi:hypothetical protein
MMYLIGNGADGTAASPDGQPGGFLFGNGGKGFTYDASTFPSGSSCTGGNGGAAGIFGSGGHGGAGWAGGPGGNGGIAGWIGLGGNGGAHFGRVGGTNCGHLTRVLIPGV